MEQRKSKIKHAVSAIVFLLIASVIFVCFTYVFRTTKGNGRLNIVSFYNEKKDTVDMVVVGGSAVYRYWDPMQAYEDSGMTSFVFACASMNGQMYRCAVEEVLSRQNPKLLVIDGRRFISRCVEEKKDTVRFFSDSIDMNLNRMVNMYKYCRTYGMSFPETVSYMLDLCMYHNNMDALTSKTNWKLWDNRYVNTSGNFIKGYGLSGAVKRLKGTPEELAFSTQTTPLGPVTEKAYRDFLEYLKTLDQEILIVFTPAQSSEADIYEFNELMRIAGEYGFPVWNGNHFYEEMGLDFSTDFYNAHHTNILGAEKVTGTLMEYIKENYELPDHRELKDRTDWDELLPFYHEMKTKAIEKAEAKIASRGKADAAEEIPA